MCRGARRGIVAPSPTPHSTDSMPELVFVAGRRAVHWRDLDAWRESDIDGHAGRFRSGVDVWIVQTYLHVRDALAADGWTVRFSDRFAPGTICVAHWDELHRLRWRAPLAHIVGVRADRPPLHVADWVVRQNTLQEDDDHQVGIPNWPQPGIVARDPSRGDRVQRIGYFGRLAMAPAFFADPAFRDRLAALGLEFVPSENDWQNYRDIDVVIAFRTAPTRLLQQKPVTKVSNAWLAGVPAIVGPEPAYLQVKRDDIDMFVAQDANAVIAALAALIREPARYRAMRDRARSRAAEFDVPAIRERWLAFFRQRVAPAFDRWREHGSSPLVRYPWYLDALLRQRLAAKRFRARVAAERTAMGDHPSIAAAGLSPFDGATRPLASRDR
jgi:hypothetical protein